MFITFEGGEGSGKTTLIELIKKTLENDKKILITREPGGTKIAEAIRSVLLDVKHEGMNCHTEALLYAASRAEHIDMVIKDGLKTHDIILCDRYIDSSLAYQGHARSLGIDYVLKINDYALNYMPDLTFYIDIDPEVGLERIKNRDKFDRLDKESLSFHKKVREGYLNLLELYPNRVVKINGHQNINDIFNDVIKVIKERL